MRRKPIPGYPKIRVGGTPPAIIILLYYCTHIPHPKRGTKANANKPIKEEKHSRLKQTILAAGGVLGVGV